jgi:hypothetical protein
MTKNNIKQDFIRTLTNGTGINVISSYSSKKYIYVMGLVSISANGMYNDFTNKPKTSLPLVSSTSMFIAKLTQDGNQEYFKITGSNNQSSISYQVYGDLVCDDKDNIYITGNMYINPTGSYSDFNGKLATNLSYADNNITFIAKLNKYGHQEWYKVTFSNSNSNLAIIWDPLCNNIYKITQIMNQIHIHFLDQMQITELFM